MIKQPNVTLKIILKYKNQIAIFKNPDGNFEFPGGRMEWKETIRESLDRELKEELSYSLEREPKLFDVWNYISKNGKRHSVMIYFIYFLRKKPRFSSPIGLGIFWLTKKDFIKMKIIRNKEFLNKMFAAKPSKKLK